MKHFSFTKKKIDKVCIVNAENLSYLLPDARMSNKLSLDCEVKER